MIFYTNWTVVSVSALYRAIDTAYAGKTCLRMYKPSLLEPAILTLY